MRLQRIFILLMLYAAGSTYASLSLNSIVDEEPRPPLDGIVCAYGDFNKDRYTDIIVQRNQFLVILLQTEQGTFEEDPKRYGRIDLGSTDEVLCSVADFDGDTSLDVLVTKVEMGSGIFFKSADEFKPSIYFYKNHAFEQQTLNYKFMDQPAVVDINGDGRADIIGFVENTEGKPTLFCMAGNKTGKVGAEEDMCADKFIGFDNTSKPFPKFSPIFADFDGDLAAEIVFGLEVDSKLRLSFWKMKNHNFEWELQAEMSKPIPSSYNFQYFGGAVVSDVNADSNLDILVPICQEESCKHVTNMLIWTKNDWITFQLDLKVAELVVDTHSRTIFRVGDFSLDGYPDLVATVNINGKTSPMILENVEYTDDTAFSRKFNLKTAPIFVMPSEMSLGQMRLSAFFDLKEDGNLDLLIEYKAKDGKIKIGFIKCDDKGDTTFLKVQIFTNVCTRQCPITDPLAKNSELGSGITWHGACVSFRMSDSWGGNRYSIQCQLPQTSHRVLYSPFVLFGLGRSPNFVDEVKMGSPRWSGNEDNQRHNLKQIVPNSRIIVVPPEKDETHWDSRLYLTPSRLIIQSLLVLVSVCLILLILIAGFHFRERHQDRKERQQQTHRFHFDAM